MSVINQMLKELDQRSANNKSGAEVVLPLKHYDDSEKIMGWKVKTIFVLLITVIILLAIIVYLFVLKPGISDSDQGLNEVQDTAPMIDSGIDMKQRTSEDKFKQSVTVDAKSDQSEQIKPIEKQIDLSEAAQVFEKNMLLNSGTNNLQQPVSNTISAEEIIFEPIITEQSTAEPVRIIKSKLRLSLKNQTEKLFSSARNAFAAGNFTAANNLLAEALSLDSNFHKARILLLSILLEQQQSVAMEKELKTSLVQWPEITEYRQMQARLLIQNGQLEQALDVMQKNIPRVAKAADYHALLAYIAQQTKHDQLAAKHYQLLVQRHPNRANWWLGLAVSEERLGNKDVALQAYRQSIGRPGLSQSVATYARQRIKAIQGF